MKKLAKYHKDIDALDLKIVRLFERRMCTVKKIAAYRIKHDLLPDDEPTPRQQIVKKTTECACDTEVITYTEGLIMYILTVSEEFYRNIKKRRKSR